MMQLKVTYIKRGSISSKKTRVGHHTLPDRGSEREHRLGLLREYNERGCRVLRIERADPSKSLEDAV